MAADSRRQAESTGKAAPSPSADKSIRAALVRDIIDTQDYLITQVDAQGRFTWVNQAAEKFFGCSPAECIGLSALDFVHPDDRARTEEGLAEFIRMEKDRFEFENRQVSLSGEVHDVLWTIHPHRNKAGRVTHINSIAHDITQRKRAETALRGGEERFRSLVVATSSVVWTTDDRGRFVSPQPSWEVYTGQSWEDYSGWGWVDALHPDDQRRIADEWARAIMNRRVYRTEGRLWNAAAGAFHHFVVRAVPLFDPNGNLREWIGALYDNHAQKTAEQARMESEQQFRSTFEQAAIGLAHIAPDGRWLRVNGKLCQVLGYTHERLLSITFEACTHPEDRDLDREAIRRVLAGDSDTYSIEKRLIRANGSVIWANLTVSLVRSQDGEAKYFIAAIEDISDRRRAQEERERLVHDLGERVKELRCIHAVSEAVHLDQPLEEVFAQVLAAIPPGWHYPDITRARLLYDGRQYAPVLFQTTGWMQSAEIYVDGRPRGTLEVYYLEQMPELDEGPFLKEERALIDAIAHTLGQAVEHRAARDALQRAYDQLEQRVAQRTADLERTTETLRDEIIERQQAEQETALKNAVLDGINRLLREAMQCDSDRDVATICLEVAEQMTGSEFGFIIEAHSDKPLEVLAASDPASLACPVDDAQRGDQSFLARTLGLHEKALREQQPLIVNDPPADPELVARTDQGSALSAFMGVPMLRAGRIIGLIALANKPGGYQAADAENVSDLSGIFLEALFSKRAEQQVAALNAELRDNLAELRAVNEGLEAFSYSVSHDLRAPLRAMDGFSRALMEDYAEQLDEEARGYLRRVRGASMRMGELIDDLLKLSRVTRADFNRERVDLDAMARSIGNDLISRHPDRRIALEIAPDMNVRADARLVRVLLDNLLGNAVKFTANREQAIIEVGVSRDGDEEVYFVRDNGTGFDMAYVDKLFTPFQRLHSESEFPGTGIGLATVQRVVQRHGGRAWAEGAPDKGATIYFTLS